MPGPVSFKADVRRRIIQILIAIVPDAPFPTKLIEKIVSFDSMTGGPTDFVIPNLHAAALAAPAGIKRIHLPNEIFQDTKRGTITITSAGQTLLREQLKRLPLTSQARERLEHGLDDIGLYVLGELYDIASFLPGSDSEDAFTPDLLALSVPHFLYFNRALIAEPDGDWWPAQALATLWLLNDHGVVPENILFEHTQALINTCEPYYHNWGWEAVNMFNQSVEEMINARWSEAVQIGGRLLTMAETMTDALDEPEEREKFRKDILDLRQKLAALTNP